MNSGAAIDSMAENAICAPVCLYRSIKNILFYFFLGESTMYKLYTQTQHAYTLPRKQTKLRKCKRKLRLSMGCCPRKEINISSKHKNVYFIQLICVGVSCLGHDGIEKQMQRLGVWVLWLEDFFFFSFRFNRLDDEYEYFIRTKSKFIKKNFVDIGKKGEPKLISDVMCITSSMYWRRRLNVKLYRNK